MPAYDGNRGQSVMAWSAIHHGERSELVVVDGAMNWHRYCSEIQANYHLNPTPDRWPLDSLPLGSKTGIQVAAVVWIGSFAGRRGFAITF